MPPVEVVAGKVLEEEPTLLMPEAASEELGTQER